MLLETSAKLDKPLEERNEYASNLLKNIPENIDTIILIRTCYLFIRADTKNNMHTLYTNYFNGKLETLNEEYTRNLLFVIIEGFQLESINLFIDEYLSLDKPKLDIGILYCVCVYSKVYNHKKIPNIRKYLTKFINTEYDTVEYRILLLDNICFYEHSEESLNILKLYYSSIKDKPDLEYKKYFIQIIIKFIFFDMMDSAVEWIYYFWKNDVEWDLWKQFPVGISHILSSGIKENNNRMFYVLKHLYKKKECIVVLDTNTIETKNIVDSIFEVPCNSDEYNILSNAKVNDEIELFSKSIKGKWIINDTDHTLKFLFNFLIKNNGSIIERSINLNAIEKERDKDPENAHKIIFEIIDDMTESIKNIKNNQSETLNQDSLKKIDYINYMSNISILNEFIGSSNRLLPNISKDNDYLLFCYIMNQKPTFIFDSINLYLLFILECNGIKMRELFSEINILTTTWTYILNYVKDTSMTTQAIHFKNDFIQWCKKNVNIIDHHKSISISTETNIDLICIAQTAMEIYQPVRVSMIYTIFDVEILKKGTNNPFIYNIIYLLEYAMSYSLININELIEAIHILGNFFMNDRVELYKITLRYIWNDLAEDRNNFNDWNELNNLNTIVNVETILEELYNERPIENLKEFIIKNIAVLEL